MADLALGQSGKVVPWCDPAVVSADKRVENVELPDGITWVDLAQAASEQLFKFSGARWMGARTDLVRPHRLGDDCSCNMDGPAFMGWDWSGVGGWWNRRFPEGWGCSCAGARELVLASPVTAIVEVKVDGQVLDPSTYTVFDNMRLVRLADPATGAYLSWPCCQRLMVPTTERGTWSLKYTHGAPPPKAGALAGYEFTLQLGLHFDTKGPKLPARAGKVSRQNVDVEIEATSMMKDGLTGYPIVDLFLEAYNPNRITRRARIYSPDDVIASVQSSSQP